MKQSMQEKHLYEYSVIRVVPRVERFEFFNAGVIVYCSACKFLQTVYEINHEKLKAFSRDVDVLQLEQRLHAFDQICAASAEGGPIAKLPIASRFRWLTASRSTVIQTSPVHPGFCVDPATMLLRLHKQLVQ